MSEPNPIQVPIPEVVQNTNKAITATVTTVLGVLTLLGTCLADGVLDWSEGGTLIGAVATAGATVYGVWKVGNRITSVTMR